MIYLRVLNPPNTSLVALPCFFGIIDCAELQAVGRPADPLRVPSPWLKSARHFSLHLNLCHGQQLDGQFVALLRERVIRSLKISAEGSVSDDDPRELIG